MMEMVLERLKSDGNTTMGILMVNGRFQSFTLEDEYRTKKVMHETRIPAGDYAIRLRNFGSMAPRYNAQFSEHNHRGMLHLQHVPGFEYIYIHVGNDDDDTSGCILVGFGADFRTMTISRSRDAYAELYSSVADAAEADQLMIHIRDYDL